MSDERVGVPVATEHHTAQLLGSLHEEFRDVHRAATIDEITADSRARFESMAAVEQFVPILAHRLARERLQALARLEGKLPRDRPEVLFIGLEGRGRSQMAASLADLRSQGKINVHAAGTSASAQRDDNVSAAMAEAGIDLADVHPMPLTDEALAGADVVVTMGRSVGGVQVPAGTRHEDWRIGDPVGAGLPEVRRIRDEIDARVQALVSELTETEADTPEEDEPREG